MAKYGHRTVTLSHTRTQSLSASMPQKVVVTSYPLIDADPHASRVIKYFRPSDLASWAIGTAGFPGLLYLWGI